MFIKWGEGWVEAGTRFREGKKSSSCWLNRTRSAQPFSTFPSFGCRVKTNSLSSHRVPPAQGFKVIWRRSLGGRESITNDRLAQSVLWWMWIYLFLNREFCRTPHAWQEGEKKFLSERLHLLILFKQTFLPESTGWRRIFLDEALAWCGSEQVKVEHEQCWVAMGAKMLWNFWRDPFGDSQRIAVSANNSAEIHRRCRLILGRQSRELFLPWKFTNIIAISPYRNQFPFCVRVMRENKVSRIISYEWPEYEMTKKLARRSLEFMSPQSNFTGSRLELLVVYFSEMTRENMTRKQVHN